MPCYDKSNQNYFHSHLIIFLCYTQRSNFLYNFSSLSIYWTFIRLLNMLPFHLKIFLNTYDYSFCYNVCKLILHNSYSRICMNDKQWCLFPKLKVSDHFQIFKKNLITDSNYHLICGFRKY